MRTRMCMMLLPTLLLLLLGVVQGYPYFQDRLPNGGRVPHPCKASHLWHGVGHLQTEGGGPTNAFGEDFRRNGFVWDECLCRADSDQDGRSNGEELGDPDCMWKVGDTLSVTLMADLGHPGVCQPLNDPKCQRLNDWQFCDVPDFECPAFKEEGVMNFTLQFPRTAVPEDETTYICMMFDVPNDAEYHVIGSVPNIDNVNVMHHMSTRICTEDASAKMPDYSSPRPCGMEAQQCGAGMVGIGGWTVGMKGHCLPAEFGIPLGPRVQSHKVILEFHWNNPEKLGDYMDASGMTFFYEKRKRKHDSGGAVIGSMSLEIPPSQTSWEQYSVCEPRCTQDMPQSVYIAEILPHMHYLGRAMIVEHWRGEERLNDLVNQIDYRYDTPVSEQFRPATEFRPGDKLITRCFFNSHSVDGWTFYGDGTQDEMCFAIIMYYPNIGEFACIGSKETTWCEDGILVTHTSIEELMMSTNTSTKDGKEANSTSTEDNAREAEPTGCDHRLYFNTVIARHFSLLYTQCDQAGLECLPGCQDALAKVMTHPCLDERAGPITRMFAAMDDAYGKPFVRMLNSCRDIERSPVPEPKVFSELCASAHLLQASITMVTITVLRALMFMMT